jgi:hypothetical protein
LVKWSANFEERRLPHFIVRPKDPKIAEQCDPPNGYSRHASSLGSFLARQESRHGQPSVIADVRKNNQPSKNMKPNSNIMKKTLIFFVFFKIFILISHQAMGQLLVEASRTLDFLIVIDDDGPAPINNSSNTDGSFNTGFIQSSFTSSGTSITLEGQQISNIIHTANLLDVNFNAFIEYDIAQSGSVPWVASFGNSLEIEFESDLPVSYSISASTLNLGFPSAAISLSLVSQHDPSTHIFAIQADGSVIGDTTDVLEPGRYFLRMFANPGIGGHSGHFGIDPLGGRFEFEATASFIAVPEPRLNILLGFLIVALMFYRANVMSKSLKHHKVNKITESEQCDPPNGYPRHASCLGSFLARHESRHG